MLQVDEEAEEEAEEDELGLDSLGLDGAGLEAEGELAVEVEAELELDPARIQFSQHLE